MWGGIWFQILGPQTEKALFPNWVRVLMTTAAMTTAALVVEERRWRHPDSSVLNLMILVIWWYWSKGVATLPWVARDFHLCFNQHSSSSLSMHSALPACPWPLVRSLQLVEVWPYSEERKKKTWVMFACRNERPRSTGLLTASDINSRYNIKDARNIMP